jgi:hypothetical protein
MGSHLPFGLVRVAGLDGAVDIGMCLTGDPVLAGNAQRNLPLVHQPFDDGGMDRGIDRISRNDGQGIVKGDIGLAELLYIAHRPPIGVERSFKSGQVLRRGVLGGVAGKARFE